MNILIILIELYKQLKEEILLIILYLVHILEQWWGEGDKNLTNGKHGFEPWRNAKMDKKHS